MIKSKHIGAEDDIDLLKMILLLLSAWKTILSITIFCTGFAIAYALIAPESFKAEVLLASAQEEKSASPSALSQFGGLAAMAGISIPSDSNVEEVIATLKSRRFLQLYISKNKLMPILFDEIWDSQKKSWLVESDESRPTEQKAVDSFKSNLSVFQDEKSGLITLSVSWKDPKLAAKWANDLVKQLNEQLREKAIADSQKRVGYLEQELAKTTLQDMRAVLYNLLESEKQKAMLANVNEDFALEVIDPAVVPEFREKPKRRLIVILGCFCGIFLGVFAVFFIEFLHNLKASSF